MRVQMSYNDTSSLRIKSSYLFYAYMMIVLLIFHNKFVIWHN